MKNLTFYSLFCGLVLFCACSHGNYITQHQKPKALKAMEHFTPEEGFSFVAGKFTMGNETREYKVNERCGLTIGPKTLIINLPNRFTSQEENYPILSEEVERRGRIANILSSPGDFPPVTSENDLGVGAFQFHYRDNFSTYKAELLENKTWLIEILPTWKAGPRAVTLLVQPDGKATLTLADPENPKHRPITYYGYIAGKDTDVGYFRE